MGADTAVTVIGRPTVYDPKYCDAVIEYFERPRKPRRVLISQEPGKGVGEWKKQYKMICAELPDFSGFAREIGHTRKSLVDWQKRYPDFAEACARAREIAESIVADRGNNGLYNAQFAAFYMKNVFNWKEKTETEIVSSQDTADAGNMREALACMTPEELSQFASIVGTAQSRRAALISAPDTD